MIAQVFLGLTILFGSVATGCLIYGIAMKKARRYSITVKDKPVQTGTIDVKR